MGTVTKGAIMRSDLDNYDGTLATSRTSSSGGTETGLKVGNAVDVLMVFGSGDTSNQTDATITDALNSLGSTNIALVFAPGTWTISNTITIGSNFTVIVPAGCVFDIASGKTMTVQGVLFRQHDTYSSGDGTFTLTGPDIMGPKTITDPGTVLATYISTDAGTSAGPILKLHRNSASPADADFIGAVYFDGEDDGDTQTTYASIEAQIDDVTDTTEDGTLLVKTMENGTLTTQIDISSAGATYSPPIKADTISEKTSDSGVTIESALIKDGVVNATGDTSAGDNAAMGYTATEGLVLTGQGSTNDITLKNDADETVASILTGTKIFSIPGILNIGSATTLTLSSDAVTITTSNHTIAAESGTTDNLATISGGTDGDIIVLRPDSGDTITVQDNTGNIRCAGDFAMDSTQDRMVLHFNGTNWMELCRSNNA